MVAPTLSIAPVKAALPERQPHLMPFHVAYTGPAPISTYFRVKPAPDASTHPKDVSKDTGDAKEAEDTTAVVIVASEQVAVEVDSTAVVATVSVVVPNPPDVPTPSTFGLIQKLSKTAKRFVSAFRGRVMHGVEVALPEGYSGVVLRGDADMKGKAKESSGRGRNGNGRPTRRSAKSKVDATEEDEEQTDIDEPLVRTLKPTAQFSSFVLWHPDIPVDEGKDEYLRSLTEWVSLAAEIHRVEE
ncbi:hypothetical protein BV25DRAFT_1918988 [Artomyces pyxidatus]|uniref:Uncharacterized protein n=1 Tax=Artomyces pyxidatus TaxID=48021 RepID=A0ACB8ST51_9AGAM|nr:hypothetical protein BV25DRAFT_1918988 [Artomyces pyxidatus]